MKVVAAFMQNAVNVPGSEILGYESLIQEKVAGIEMEVVPEGLLVTTPKLRAKSHAALVPSANVKVCIVEWPQKKKADHPFPNKNMKVV